MGGMFIRNPSLHCVRGGAEARGGGVDLADRRKPPTPTEILRSAQNDINCLLFSNQRTQTIGFAPFDCRPLPKEWDGLVLRK